MPIHDWTKVNAGLFHAVHQMWVISLSAALNDGILPSDHYALPEQNIGGPIPDVLTLRRDVESDLLVIDLLPPTPRDPNGIHAAIWDDDYISPADKPLTAAAYDAEEKVAYVESLAVGDPLPEMPVFLRGGYYVSAPLAHSYAAAWKMFPTATQGLLQ